MEEFNFWLKCHKCCFLDSGSQGVCYKIGNKVYKIFLQFVEEEYDDVIVYSKEDILRFSSVNNSTYIFPTDVIMVGDIIVGYVTDYVDAKSLYKTNPLMVDLDRFEKSIEKAMEDIRIISNSGILTFDVAYNILYGKCGFNVIDTLEYTRSDIDSERLYLENLKRYNFEIRLFLIDGYFDKFINNSKILYDMYCDEHVDMIQFLGEFRKRLSEVEGCEISNLMDARNSLVIRRGKYPKYIRELW